MKTLVNVARYHLVDRITYVALPWGILAFSFLINLAVAAMAPQQPGGIHSGLVIVDSAALYLVSAASYPGYVQPQPAKASSSPITATKQALLPWTTNPSPSAGGRKGGGQRATAEKAARQ